jgi:hypothetical protein
MTLGILKTVIRRMFGTKGHYVTEEHSIIKKKTSFVGTSGQSLSGTSHREGEHAARTIRI